MAYLDPKLMGVFSRKMMNPTHYRNVYGILRSFCYHDLQCSEGAYDMVDRLS